MKYTARKQETLLELLQVALHGKSRTGLKSLVAKRMVQVDGMVATRLDQIIIIGQVIEIVEKAPRQAVVLHGLKICYEDDAVIVIDKNAGLLSVPKDTGVEKSAHSILSAFAEQRDRNTKYFIVHRLDRDTSGIMMFVKNKDLQRAFRQNWQDIVSRRTYAVVVEGRLREQKGTLTTWLHGTDNLRSYSGEAGSGAQKAISHFKVLSQNDAYSLLEVELETGRKNQIRVHMQDLGHPVVGDSKYGATNDPIARLALHAQLLEFKQPETNEVLSFSSETPAAFLQLVKKTTNS